MTDRLDDLHHIQIAKARAKETPVKISIDELQTRLPLFGAEGGKRTRRAVYKMARKRID
ncbi:MAG: hypothetical protein LCH88_06720 [Proteobacteria bacterium]|nr:hypothetical protein [Pseudomonadota bacterium]